MKTHNPIITRFKKNPILTKKDVPYPVATVHNAGIVKHNGRYIMLFRSHLLNGRSIIGRADSEDGFSFTVHPKPFLIPSTDNVFAEYEAFGVEDLRICPVEGEYLLTYSAYSRHGVRIKTDKGWLHIYHGAFPAENWRPLCHALSPGR